MMQEIVEFWQRNKTPVGRMVYVGETRRGLKREQIEIAAQEIYWEANELLENLPELRGDMGVRTREKIILMRNSLEPARLARKVYEYAQNVPVKHEKDNNIMLGELLDRVKCIENKLTWKKRLITWFFEQEGQWL
jgi:hypothetical protein